MRNIFSLIIIGFMLVPDFSQSADDTGQSEIQLRTYIEQENIPLNREVIFHIELSWPGDLSRYKISEIVEPTVTNLTTRGSGSSNKVRTDGDGKLKSIKEITFYFRPLEMGMAYIDGVIINYQDTATQKDESLISSRIGVKIIEPLPEPSQNTADAFSSARSNNAFVIFSPLYRASFVIESAENCAADAKNFV